MPDASSHDVTSMLAAWREGDQASLDRLVARVYPELRQIARRQLRGRHPGESLDTASLANEAYLKLVRAGAIGCENRAHFLALCAQVMRRIIVDHARERASAKRGGDAVRIPLDEVPLPTPDANVDLLALDEVLSELARIDPRKSRVIELRYFGGMTIEETAEALSLSPETAKRDWRMARAWLLARLSARSE